MQKRGGASMAELLEAMPGYGTRKCEAILALLAELCKDQTAASVALSHSLTVPLLTQNILGKSPICTAMAVSVLWHLCRCSPDGLVMVEALQSGAFQKLIIIAQMGVPPDTKRRVCELLKLFNHFRGPYECTDPRDFQYLRRSF